jgi:hypothetical protein
MQLIFLDRKGMDGFDLKKLYVSGFLKTREEIASQITSFIIYTQYNLSLTDLDADYFTPVSESE